MQMPTSEACHTPNNQEERTCGEMGPWDNLGWETTKSKSSDRFQSKSDKKR